MFNIERDIEHSLQTGKVTVAGFSVAVGPDGETFAVRLS